MPEQLIAGVDTFVSASWSSGTGFAAAAELEIGVGFRQIEGGLNQGGNGSIESLLINPSAKGIIGSDDQGPLIVDCANSTDATVRNAGEVDLRIEAASASKVERITTANSRARTRCIDGQFDIVSITAGRLSISEAATLDDYYGLGGKGIISYNSDVIDGVFDITGGEHTLKRRANTIRVGAGATLIIDHDPQISSWTGDTIELFGGTIILKRGTIPSITGIGGVIDYSQAREAIGSGLGSVKHELSGTVVIPHPDVTPTTATNPAGIYRNESGPVDVGGFVPLG